MLLELEQMAIFAREQIWREKHTTHNYVDGQRGKDDRIASYSQTLTTALAAILNYTTA